MISTELSRSLSEELVRIYQQAEYLMLQKIAKRVKRNALDEGWTELKAKEIQEIRADIEKNALELSKLSDAELTKIIKDAYKSGRLSTQVDFDLANTKYKIPHSLVRLIKEANEIVEDIKFTILRETIDVYRNVQAEMATQVLTGVETRKQVAKKMLNRLANVGITGFVDKLGRNWSLTSYIEMATRSLTSNAMLQGHIDRQTEANRDLIIISDHAGECPLCRPWENKVLSISGDTPGYKTLDQAKAAGLFHPNCRHNITGYIPGFTKPNTVTSGASEQYEYTQKQRYNERQIRRWKRRELVAIDNIDSELAKAKIKEYQDRQVELLKEYEEKFNMKLFRRRSAEQI
jgi:hypothetical protein